MDRKRGREESIWIEGGGGYVIERWGGGGYMDRESGGGCKGVYMDREEWGR